MAGTADWTTTPNSPNVWLEGILWGSEWDSGGAASEPTYVSVYVGGLRGDEPINLDGQSVTATVPLTQEIQAMLGAQEAMEAVCGIQFLNAPSQAEADLIWASVDNIDADGALGWANPPGTAFSTTLVDWQSVVAINYEVQDPTFPNPNHLIPGGYDFVTFIHELGHALGLAHPHDTGDGTSTIFPGVTSEFDDFGRFDMNQGIYTMMSYNDGWKTGPAGLPPGTTYGFEMGPMAIDIAALQLMYGANTSYHKGSDVYALPTANRPGTGYLCLWDAGGMDKIVGGDFGNVIDLRAATLRLEAGGGGWVSYANGIHGGFTIAKGAVIENAVGGDGVDRIQGNGAANTLVGLEGKDILLGATGNDVLRGGLGDDRLTGGAGQDILRGGEGADDFLFTAVTDSAGAVQDRIESFQRGLDDIDVSAIDARTTVAGNDAFVLDAGGTFVAGEIRQEILSGNLILQFNVDGDPAIEMTILLAGVTARLTAADFIL